jgi:hypothetical protein
MSSPNSANRKGEVSEAKVTRPTRRQLAVRQRILEGLLEMAEYSPSGAAADLETSF